MLPIGSSALIWFLMVSRTFSLSRGELNSVLFREQVLKRKQVFFSPLVQRYIPVPGAPSKTLGIFLLNEKSYFVEGGESFT